MFGMGFTEIVLIAIVAIIFLGPEKLPSALVDIAKFFKAVKKTINDAKESLDKEVNLTDMKKEALSYKESFELGASEFKGEFDIDKIESHNQKILDKEKADKGEKNV